METAQVSMTVPQPSAMAAAVTTQQAPLPLLLRHHSLHLHACVSALLLFACQQRQRGSVREGSWSHQPRCAIAGITPPSALKLEKQAVRTVQHHKTSSVQSQTEHQTAATTTTTTTTTMPLTTTMVGNGWWCFLSQHSSRYGLHPHSKRRPQHSLPTTATATARHWQRRRRRWWSQPFRQHRCYCRCGRRERLYPRTTGLERRRRPRHLA